LCTSWMHNGEDDRPIDSGMHVMRAGDPWRQARELAARTRACVTAEQLREIGIYRGSVAHRLKSGELVAMHRGVYCFGPIPPAGADEMAAVLACQPRSCASHASAAYLLELPPFPARPRPVHITVSERHIRSRDGIVVHHTSTLLRSEVAILDGIPVTTPARTICDLAALLPTAELEHLLAEAYAKGKTTRAKLISSARRTATLPGIPSLRRLLDAPTKPARTRSRPERRALALIRKAQLPLPEVNARLRGYEVDLLWPEHKLVVEVDALSTHSDPRAFERDRRRDADLTLRGYTVVRITRRQIDEEPEAVVARLAAAVALRRAA
jgi:very-short-patch-repair endonuclease